MKARLLNVRPYNELLLCLCWCLPVRLYRKPHFMTGGSVRCKGIGIRFIIRVRLANRPCIRNLVIIHGSLIPDRNYCWCTRTYWRTDFSSFSQPFEFFVWSVPPTFGPWDHSRFYTLVYYPSAPESNLGHIIRPEVEGEQNIVQRTWDLGAILQQIIWVTDPSQITFLGSVDQIDSKCIPVGLSIYRDHRYIQ